MPATILAANQPGPLPLDIPFNAPTDGPAVLMVIGSVWSQTENTLIGIEILLDGTGIGASPVYSNGTATHRVTVPTFINVDLASGDHSLQLTAGDGPTVTDSNDYYSVVLLY
jgi:hypothetical protein